MLDEAPLNFGWLIGHQIEFAPPISDDDGDHPNVRAAKELADDPDIRLMALEFAMVKIVEEMARIDKGATRAMLDRFYWPTTPRVAIPLRVIPEAIKYATENIFGDVRRGLDEEEGDGPDG